MINEIKEALEKATVGPWGFAVFEDSRHVVYDHTYFNRHIAEIVRGGVDSEQREEDNARLIANTPTYIRYLLDELDVVKEYWMQERELANGQKEVLLKRVEELEKECDIRKMMHQNLINEVRHSNTDRGHQ